MRIQISSDGKRIAKLELKPGDLIVKRSLPEAQIDFKAKQILVGGKEVDEVEVLGVRRIGFNKETGKMTIDGQEAAETLRFEAGVIMMDDGVTNSD